MEDQNNKKNKELEHEEFTPRLFPFSLLLKYVLDERTRKKKEDLKKVVHISQHRKNK